MPTMRTGWWASRDRSRPMPTETKNRPSSRPLKGSIVTSISWRNSVSASSRPAMKAPSAMDRPLSALSRPAPMTTSRQAAMNSSSLLARATDFIIGRRTSRPATTRTTRPMAAGAKASSSLGDGASPAWPAATARVIRIGATARSWNSSTEKMARPAGECWRLRSASRGMTIAVDDRARAAPIARAAGQGWPRAWAAAAMTPRQTATCRPPRPNTIRRMRRRRSQDSSSPIMNSRKTTPSSASWATCSGSLIVKVASQGAVLPSAPSPNGPSTTPASRKPRIGLIFQRRNRGATTPAVTRNSTMSLYPAVAAWASKVRGVSCDSRRSLWRAGPPGEIGLAGFAGRRLSDSHEACWKHRPRPICDRTGNPGPQRCSRSGPRL